MSIQEITDIEEKNEDCIFLYKEGIFWKAYQRSAFLTVTRFRPDFMVKVKYMKCVGMKVFSVGFPTTSLSSVFGESPIEEINEKRIRILTPGIDEEAYKLWMADVSDKADEKKTVNSASSSDDEKSIGLSVLQRLKDFNVSASTPVECMMLVCELQKMIP